MKKPNYIDLIEIQQQRQLIQIMIIQFSIVTTYFEGKQGKIITFSMVSVGKLILTQSSH